MIVSLAKMKIKKCAILKKMKKKMKTNVDEFITHNQITDHCLDNRNDVGTPFSSNKIKYVTKSWKQNSFLNVSKLVGIFRNS